MLQHAESVSLPGFDIDDDNEDGDVDDTAGCSDGEDEIDDLNDTSLIPKRISCFAHTLQLCVKAPLNVPLLTTENTVWESRQWFQYMKPTGTHN